MKTTALEAVIQFAAANLDGTKREGLSHEADAELVALTKVPAVTSADVERAATLAWNEALNEAEKALRVIKGNIGGARAAGIIRALKREAK